MSDIDTIAPKEPEKLFTDADHFNDLEADIKALIAGFTADTSTKDGREAIASFAYKIARVKTTVDKTGKALGDDARKKLDELNASRKDYSNRLQALQDQVRLPLTEWEKEEKSRVQNVDAFFDTLKHAGFIPAGATSEQLKERLRKVEMERIEDELFQERASEARETRARIADTLRDAIKRVEQEEHDRAELERLRKAEAERQAREAEEARRKETEELALRQEEERKAEQAEDKTKPDADILPPAQAPSTTRRADDAVKQPPASTETMAKVDMLSFASKNGFAMSPDLARLLVEKIKAGQIRGVSWKV